MFCKSVTQDLCTDAHHCLEHSGDASKSETFQSLGLLCALLIRCWAITGHLQRPLWLRWWRRPAVCAGHAVVWSFIKAACASVCQQKGLLWLLCVPSFKILNESHTWPCCADLWSCLGGNIQYSCFMAVVQLMSSPGKQLLKRSAVYGLHLPQPWKLTACQTLTCPLRFNCRVRSLPTLLTASSHASRDK